MKKIIYSCLLKQKGLLKYQSLLLGQVDIVNFFDGSRCLMNLSGAAMESLGVELGKNDQGVIENLEIPAEIVDYQAGESVIPVIDGKYYEGCSRKEAEMYFEISDIKYLREEND